MFKSESMLAFDNLDQFFTFHEQLGIGSQWQVMSGHPNSRGERIRDKKYVEILRNLFMKKRLFRRNVSVAEIVSWLDSFTIISRVIQNLKETLDLETYQSIKMFFEYKIEMSKNRRIDYVFVYKKRILLTEFRLSEKFPNVSNTWHKKELELIIYKELLKNYIPEDYKILVYAFIAMPETGGLNDFVKEKKYNEDNVRYFAEYIRKYLLGIDSAGL